MKAKAVWLVLAMVLMAGCAKVEVKILEVHPTTGTGWNTTFAHVLVEDVSTKERWFVRGLWGQTGEVFVVSSDQLTK